MVNYLLYYAISKNYSRRNGKRKIFLETRFFGYQKPVFPLFLCHFKSDRAENFFGEISSWAFVFFGYLIPIKFGMFRKIFRIQKTYRFCKVLSILVLQPEVFGIFEKKKRPSRLGPSIHSKNFSSNG